MGEDDVLLHESPWLKSRMLAVLLLSSCMALSGLLISMDDAECTEASDFFRGMEMVGCWTGCLD
jgi:hypothetical protein